MTQSVTLTHSLINSGTPVTLQCSRIQAGNKRALNAKPNANVDGPVEVQGKAAENRRLVLPAVHFDTTTTIVTAEEMENLLQLEYDGTNAPILTVTYGKGPIRNVQSSAFSLETPSTASAFVDFKVTTGGFTISKIQVRYRADDVVDIGIYKNGGLYQTLSSVTTETGALDTLILSPPMAVVANDVIKIQNNTDGNTVLTSMPTASFSDPNFETATTNVAPFSGVVTFYTDDGDFETLKSMTGSTSIPVILESYNYPIDVSDSKAGYMPVGSMTFVETIDNS